MNENPEAADCLIVGRIESGNIVLSIERQTSPAHFGIYGQNLTMTEAVMVLPVIDPRRPMTDTRRSAGLNIPIAQLALPARDAAQQQYEGVPSDSLEQMRVALTEEAQRLPKVTDTSKIADQRAYARLGEIARDLIAINDLLVVRGERRHRESRSSIFGPQRTQETEENRSNNGRIYGFSGHNRFASNMWPWSKEDGVWVRVGDLAPITYNGITYPSAEHAYVAQKTTDDATRRQIAQIPSAPLAKAEGRRLALRADWDQVKNRIMYEIVRTKFQTHPKLAELLLATETQDLIEANTWNDRYWGVDSRTGQGNNTLGKILMSVRSELRNRTTEKLVEHPTPAAEISAHGREDGPRTITILFANASAPVPNIDGNPVFYVGRSPWVVEKFAGSIWERALGNAFKVTPTTPRKQAVKLFAADLERRIAAGDKPVRAALNRIAKAALNTGKVTLICHCHPQACHSHAVAKTIATALRKMGHDVRLPQTAEIERAGRTASSISR